MIAKIYNSRAFARIWLAVSLVIGLGASAIAAPTGGFLAVINELNSAGDSMRSVTFLDADDPAVPLFSVYVGREPVGSTEWEEPESMAIDPATGDVYILAFDSGNAGVPDTSGDTQGDLDLYRIPFATVYDHWAANLMGHNVRAEGLVMGPEPSGVNNSMNLDYVTYANTQGEFNAFHSNQFALAGVISKVGEIVRGNSGQFYGYPLQLVDSDTLFVLDDSVGTQTANNPLDDHSLRIIEKVSSSPGAAMITNVTPPDGGMVYRDGGWNGSTTESWESTLLTKLNMDGETHSEPRTFAYYDNGAGIRGFWIVEGDFSSTTMQSDKIGFLQLDANNEPLGFRPFVAASGNPFFLPVSDDPAVDPSSGDGKIHEVFVDADGNLVLVESGFRDVDDGVHPADQEPGILRISVDYDNGSGEMVFGPWQEKIFLFENGSGNKGPGAGTEFSQHVAFDRANNKLYFFSPETSAPFETDLHVVDLATGLTTSVLDWDDSVSLFGDADTDTVEYFFLEEAGLAGDYNGDGSVDAADYVVWRKTEINGQAGYNTWVKNFGRTSGAGSGSGLSSAAVPEPASVMLVIIGLSAFAWRRRRS